MSTILVIDSSPRGEESFSRKLSSAIVKKLKEKNPNSTVITEDISENPPPHISPQQLGAFFTPAEFQNDQQKLSLSSSDKYIHQLVSSDIIVISYPVWNFCIPSSLKAWIDQIVRVGKTFYYKESIPEGLLKGKKVYLAVARGGIYPDEYSSTQGGLFDYSIPYLKTILAYVGLRDVTVLKAEGLAIPGVKDSALEKALSLLTESL